MDQGKIRRFAERYRQMRDERLAALLAAQGTLSDEAKRALLDVIAERPDAKSIEERARGEVHRQAQLAADRPTLGFWLGFLTFGLGVAPLRLAFATYIQIRMAETQAPQLLEMGAWLTYKFLSAGLCMSVFVASGVAIHAIHAGKTRGHLWRVVAVLWYISLGVFAIDFALSGILFGFANTWAVFDDDAMMGQLFFGLFFTALWTAYLTLSKRCRRRYPNGSADGVVQVFD